MKRLLIVMALVLVGALVVPSPAAQAKTTGSYPQRAGTFLVTKDPWFTSLGLPIGVGHAAMVYNNNNVVEAICGDCRNPVTSALTARVYKKPNDWYKSRVNVTGLSTNGTTVAQDKKAAEWAHGKIGKKYNFNYWDMDTRSTFYCSQLVWAAFKDNYGINMNTPEYDFTYKGKTYRAIAPTELITTSKSYTLYTKG